MNISSNKLHFLMKLAEHSKSSQNLDLQRLEDIPISQWTAPYIEAEVEKKKKSSLLKKLLMLGLLTGGAYGAYKFLPGLLSKSSPKFLPGLLSKFSPTSSPPPWPESDNAFSYLPNPNNPSGVAAATIANDLNFNNYNNLPEDIVTGRLNDYSKIINIPNEQRIAEDAALGNTITSGFSPYGVAGQVATMAQQHPAIQSVLKNHPKIKDLITNITASSNSLPKSWIEAQHNLNDAQKAWDAEASEAIPDQSKLDQLTSNLQQARSSVLNEEAKFNTEQINNPNRATSRTWNVPESLFNPNFSSHVEELLSNKGIKLTPKELNNLAISGFTPSKLNDILISNNIPLDQIDSINREIDSSRSLISNPITGTVAGVSPALINMLGGSAGYFDTTRDIRDTLNNFRFKAPELGDSPSIGTNARGLAADLSSQFVGNTALGAASNLIKAPFTGFNKLLPNTGRTILDNLKDVAMMRGSKGLATNLGNNARFGLLANTAVNAAGKALPTFTDYYRDVNYGNMSPATALMRAAEGAESRATTGYNTRENQIFLNDRLPNYLREQKINFDSLKGLTPQEWMQVKGTNFSPNELAAVLIGKHNLDEQSARDLGSAVNRAYQTDLRTRDLYKGNPVMDFNSFKGLPSLILSGGFDPDRYDQLMASYTASRNDRNTATSNFMQGNERYSRGMQNIAREQGQDYISPLSQLNPRDYQHLMDFGSRTLLENNNGTWVNKAKPSLFNVPERWNYTHGLNTARDLYAKVRTGEFPAREFTMATNLPTDKPDQLAAGLGFKNDIDLGKYYNDYTPYLKFNIPKAAPNPLKVNPLK